MAAESATVVVTPAWVTLRIVALSWSRCRRSVVVDRDAGGLEEPRGSAGAIAAAGHACDAGQRRDHSGRCTLADGVVVALDRALKRFSAREK
jgi:hypothetical protein